jgi:tetratricopeptide (TPR) repeat protein
VTAARVAELFLREAWARYHDDRYAEALWAADRAAAIAAGGDASEPLGAITAAAAPADSDATDVGIRIRVAEVSAAALRMQGDPGAALVRCTLILSLAQDPAYADAIADVTRSIANGYLMWVECARALPAISTARLLEVLDAADAWLRAVGRPQWRSGLCSQRAQVLAQIGRADEAVDHAEEALALATARDADTPGYSSATCSWSLGDILRLVGRFDDAAVHYRRVVDDPASAAYDRKVSTQGLARCALAMADIDAARRHAEDTVREAELMGDAPLCAALDALVAVYRAANDTDAADRAARRYIDAARRVGGAYHPYFALRAAVDVALDRGDIDRTRAQALIDEWAPLALALDRSRGGAACSHEVSARRARLADTKADSSNQI